MAAGRCSRRSDQPQRPPFRQRQQSRISRGSPSAWQRRHGSTASTSFATCSISGIATTHTARRAQPVAVAIARPFTHARRCWRLSSHAHGDNRARFRAATASTSTVGIVICSCDQSTGTEQPAASSLRRRCCVAPCCHNVKGAVHSRIHLIGQHSSSSFIPSQCIQLVASCCSPTGVEAAAAASTAAAVSRTRSERLRQG